ESVPVDRADNAGLPVPNARLDVPPPARRRAEGHAEDALLDGVLPLPWGRRASRRARADPAGVDRHPALAHPACGGGTDAHHGRSRRLPPAREGVAAGVRHGRDLRARGLRGRDARVRDPAV
ncbi:MAG: hypothetical protein AVDCRST_MAG80-265, partial [uncultured Rubrobacteraceae bacterium]